jgi:glutamate/tyrosine decarboxylase-like PLP-dependent enzyme
LLAAPSIGGSKCRSTFKAELSIFQAHSSVEKAGLIGMVKMRFLPPDEKLSLRGETLKEAVTKDKEDGLIPFFVSFFIPFFVA